MIETVTAFAQVNPWFPYAAFCLLIVFLLVLDLGVFHRTQHTVGAREALAWSAVWISIGLLFGAGVWYVEGAVKGQEYLAGFLLEKSLAVDNIFVFVLIFSYFRVDPKYQHRILFYGILGAIFMRGAAIAAGAALLTRFEWLMYLFGAFLIFTGARMFTAGDNAHEGENKFLAMLSRKLPVTSHDGGGKFFVREGGRLFVTPLFLTLIAIEVSDLVFAVDSIPAVFAVTRDPFIVFTSNIFAILGLRSLYFLSAELVRRFRFLAKGVAVVLLFVGLKMLVAGYYHISSGLSLGIIGAILAVAVAVSLMWPAEEAKADEPKPHDGV